MISGESLGSTALFIFHGVYKTKNVEDDFIFIIDYLLQQYLLKYY